MGTVHRLRSAFEAPAPEAVSKPATFKPVVKPLKSLDAPTGILKVAPSPVSKDHHVSFDAEVKPTHEELLKRIHSPQLSLDMSEREFAQLEEEEGVIVERLVDDMIANAVAKYERNEEPAVDIRVVVTPPQSVFEGDYHGEESEQIQQEGTEEAEPANSSNKLSIPELPRVSSLTRPPVPLSSTDLPVVALKSVKDLARSFAPETPKTDARRIKPRASRVLAIRNRFNMSKVNEQTKKKDIKPSSGAKKWKVRMLRRIRLR